MASVKDGSQRVGKHIVRPIVSSVANWSRAAESSAKTAERSKPDKSGIALLRPSLTVPGGAVGGRSSRGRAFHLLNRGFGCGFFSGMVVLLAKT
jgi:hypothetical protein